MPGRLKKVVRVDEKTLTKETMSGVTLTLIYVCKLECGHVVKRSALRGKPGRLKCKACESESS